MTAPETNQLERSAKWNNPLVIIGLAVLLAVVMVGASYAQLRNVRDRAGRIAAELADTQQLANRVTRLRAQPALAQQHEMAEKEITTLIEHAAQQAGITSDDLVSIHPEAARRIANTAYQEKFTRLTLRNVTLRELVSFLATLNQEENALITNAMRIDAPRHATGDLDNWNVQLSLSHLIFSPAETTR